MVAGALTLAACSSPASSTTGSPSSGSPAPPAPSPSAAPIRSGTADVAFAGSLLAVDNEVVGPAFERADGYHYTGTGGGSIGLANEITAGEIDPGVFESVGAAPIEILEPARTTWYVQFAASPLVLAYNPDSPQASTFEAVAAGKEPLTRVFQVMATPGFLLGRTDPATDPQGQAFVMMVELAQRYLHLPSGIVDRILGAGAATGTGGTASQIFSETSLDSHLEAGQLDAASAFLSQAVQLHLHYIKLPAAIDFGDPADAGRYASASLVVPATTGSPTTVHGTPLVVDITTLHQAGTTSGDVAAADAFVAYQLSSAGRAAYAKEGFSLLPNTLYGARRNVPNAVQRMLTATR